MNILISQIKWVLIGEGVDARLEVTTRDINQYIIKYRLLQDGKVVKKKKKKRKVTDIINSGTT